MGITNRIRLRDMQKELDKYYEEQERKAAEKKARDEAYREQLAKAVPYHIPGRKRRTKATLFQYE